MNDEKEVARVRFQGRRPDGGTSKWEFGMIAEQKGHCAENSQVPVRGQVQSRGTLAEARSCSVRTLGAIPVATGSLRMVLHRGLD